MSARNEELSRLQAQISERESAMSLGERIKHIFKKYGVTVTAIFLAVGATIGAVLGTMTRALKKLGKGLENGLKRLEQKPIVSFIFKAAPSVIGFLAEHTWLLILAVVVFLFEELKNRRR